MTPSPALTTLSGEVVWVHGGVPAPPGPGGWGLLGCLGLGLLRGVGAPRLADQQGVGDEQDASGEELGEVTLGHGVLVLRQDQDQQRREWCESSGGAVMCVSSRRTQQSQHTLDVQGCRERGRTATVVSENRSVSISALASQHREPTQSEVITTMLVCMADDTRICVPCACSKVRPTQSQAM